MPRWPYRLPRSQRPRRSHALPWRGARALHARRAGALSGRGAGGPGMATSTSAPSPSIPASLNIRSRWPTRVADEIRRRARPSWASRSSGSASRSPSRTRWGSSSRPSSAIRCSGRRSITSPGSAEAPALALGGALLGDHRAADRGLARRRDPAPDRPPVGARATCRPTTRRRGRAASPWPLRDVPSRRRDRRPGAGRARLDGPEPGALGGDGPLRAGGRSRPRSTSTIPSGDRRLLAISEIGPWTIQCLGLHGRGDPDSLPGGRPRLREAGRPPRGPRPPRHGRGGRGVLRAVRALPRPGRDLRPGRLAQGDGSGSAGPTGRLARLPSTASRRKPRCSPKRVFDIRPPDRIEVHGTASPI